MGWLLLVPILLCLSGGCCAVNVDIIDYTKIVINDVLNGSFYSSIREKPNQGCFILLFSGTFLNFFSETILFSKHLCNKILGITKLEPCFNEFV